MLFCFVLLFTCSLFGIVEEQHPLWVGYESTLFPRTPGIQGRIEKHHFEKYLPTNPIIIEAGAYNGKDTFELSQYYPLGHVYAFEPVPYLYELIAQRCKNVSNITVYPFALSDKTGTAKFFVSTEGCLGSSSLLAPKEHLNYHPEVKFDQYIDVQTISLDDWARAAGVDHVDLLWIDMQGYEPIMLRAPSTVLKTVKVIFTEINLVEQYAGCELYPSFKSWLEEQGFVVVMEDMPWADGGNALFVKKSLINK